MGTLQSRILTDNPNLCTNCGHSLQRHRLMRWTPQKKDIKGRRKPRIDKKRTIPWLCVEEDCNCTEFLLIRSPSYR